MNPWLNQLSCNNAVIKINSQIINNVNNDSAVYVVFIVIITVLWPFLLSERFGLVKQYSMVTHTWN